MSNELHFNTLQPSLTFNMDGFQQLSIFCMGKIRSLPYSS